MGGKAGFGRGASGGGFTPAYVTSGACTSGTTSCSVVLSVTAGQFAVCGVGTTTLSTTLSCTDSSSDSLTNVPAGSPYTDATVSEGGLFEGTLGTTTSETFTCQVSASTNTMGCVVSVYSGTPTSGWDVTVAGADNAAGASPFTTGTSGVTANVSELGIGLFVRNNGQFTPVWTGTNGWTWRAGAYITQIDVELVDKILSSTGAQTATATCSSTTGGGLGMVSTIK